MPSILIECQWQRMKMVIITFDHHIWIHLLLVGSLLFHLFQVFCLTAYFKLILFVCVYFHYDWHFLFRFHVEPNTINKFIVWFRNEDDCDHSQTTTQYSRALKRNTKSAGGGNIQWWMNKNKTSYVLESLLPGRNYSLTAQAISNHIESNESTI